MKISFLVVLLCSCLSVGAQQRELSINAPRDGYYSISLSEAVIGGSGGDFGDLRIVNSNGGEVPYYLAPTTTSYRTTDFVPYKSEISQVGKNTQIVVEVGGKRINSIDFEIKNANSDKSGSISGSDDGKKWYAVRDRVDINGVYGGDSTSRFVTINFSTSDYKYYRLTLSDSISSPLNILNVGAIGGQTHTSKSEQLPVKATNIEHWSKNKHSYYKLCLEHYSPLVRIDLHVSAPKYFNRNVSIYGRHGRRNSYQLKGEGGSVFRFEVDTRADTLTIDIDNMDDAPLSVDSICAFVEARSIIAHLTQGEYKITFGDAHKMAANYDLSFVSHLPDSLPVISTEGIAVVEIEKEEQVDGGESWKIWKNILLWVAIVLVMAQILRMTLKVARKTENKG